MSILKEVEKDLKKSINQGYQCPPEEVPNRINELGYVISYKSIAIKLLNNSYNTMSQSKSIIYFELKRKQLKENGRI